MRENHLESATRELAEDLELREHGIRRLPVDFFLIDPDEHRRRYAKGELLGIMGGCYVR